MTVVDRFHLHINDNVIVLLIFLSLIDVYTVSVDPGVESIRVTWRTRSVILQQQLRSVTVNVSSECATGVLPARTQTFHLRSDEGNSVTATGLGMCA